MMSIIRTSRLTGVEHEMELNITEEQLDRWESGELIQHVMPHLTAGEREYVISGITPTEWTDMFGTN